MIRKKTASLTDKKNSIRWRSHEPTRLETFSDAVFAFAVTLIIVSLEVPKSFDELFETMKGFVAFGACFAILFLIWNNQNIFFRRFGLVDSYTTALNGILLFVVLTYTYPLKFLFTLVFSGDSTYLNHGERLSMITPEQVPQLMYVYNLGYMAIYLLFYLMYRHAQNHAEKIELTPFELFETRSMMYINLLNVLIGLIAIVVTFLLPSNLKGASGYVYFLIPVAYSIFFSQRGKKRRSLFKTA
ncbi:MAG TPA: TMEM175 family protein [Mucilaginibacter sp.]|nr:TMEM175 family protein [Mucilaginibacter sp.]